MKRILLTLGLAIATVTPSFAQYSITEAFTLAGAVASSPVVTNVINVPCRVSKILLILNGPITSPHNYAVVDAPKYSLGNVNYASNFFTTAVLELTNSVTTTVSFSTNITWYVTNYNGAWFTNTGTFLFTATNAPTATRTPYKRVLVGNTTAAGTITVFDNATTPLDFANGITFTNTASLSNATAVITYDKSL